MVTGRTSTANAPGGPWNVRFTGSFAGLNEPLLTANGSGLVGGSIAVALASQAGDADRVQTVTDPRGIATKTDYDLLGRTLRTVAAFNNNPSFTNNWNQVTENTYDGDNHLITLTVYPATGSIERTQYTYTANPADSSWLSSNDQLTKVQYPDKTTGLPSTQTADQEIYQYNNVGQATTLTQRTGTVHAYSYDVLGRSTRDAVTTFGTGVDQTVGALATAYDTYGNAATFTSYAPNGTTIINQVQDTFNGLGQLTTEAQYHGDPGNPNTAHGTVSYAYSFDPTNPNAPNHSRLVSMTYPNSRQLTYTYGAAGSVDDSISRLTAIADSTATLESYTDSSGNSGYLGLNTVVQRSHPQISVNLTYIGTPGGDANDQYVGLDRFGRVVDRHWMNTATSTDTDHFQYGYDLNGNRLYQANLVTQGLPPPPLAFDELYHASGTVDTYALGQLTSAGYDVLNQMTVFSRGTLSTDHSSISNTSHTQSWTLDALGNWTQFTSDSSTQNRTTNQQNELMQINATNLTYDNNGNTTQDDQGHTFVYDAWNRIVSVGLGGTSLTYGYDALGRRITSRLGTGSTTDLYFSSSWQVLEEQVSGAMTQQYVWSPVYVDALVERDSAGGQRLYLQQDADWNVTALVDSTGTVQERFIYDPYGKPTDATRQNVGVLNPNWTTRTGGDAYSWVYLHQGGRYEGLTGLYNFRNRDYSPALGRWLEMDPIGYQAQDGNLFRFASNNPVNNLDPSGLVILCAKRVRTSGKLADLNKQVAGRKPYTDLAKVAVDAVNAKTLYKNTYHVTLPIPKAAGELIGLSEKFPDRNGNNVPKGTFAGVHFLLYFEWDVKNPPNSFNIDIFETTEKIVDGQDKTQVPVRAKMGADPGATGVIVPLANPAGGGATHRILHVDLPGTLVRVKQIRGVPIPVVKYTVESRVSISGLQGSDLKFKLVEKVDNQGNITTKVT